MRTYLTLFLFGAFFTLVGTPLVRAMGHRLRAYGRAQAGEQGCPIPRLGGLGVLMASLAAWATLLIIHNDVRARFAANSFTLISLFVPSSLILLLGIYDDIRGLSARPKLAVEVLAALLAWWLGVRIIAVPLLGDTVHSPWLSLFLTVFWIVAVTNSVNLLDGLDGLAAGVMFFVTLTVFAISLIQGRLLVCILALPLAGALLGFLAFNFAPATIYLGDTGSLFLGFLLACLAVETSQKTSTLVALVVPYMAFGLPLFDTTLTVARRFLSGRPIFAPDHGHIHHRLLQKKWSPRTVALALYSLAALFSLGSLLIVRSTGNLVALVAVLGAVLAWFLTRELRYEEFSEVHEYLSRALHDRRRVLANQIMIRKEAQAVSEASRLEESWTLIIDTLTALGFDGVRCHLAGWLNGSAPCLPSWQRDDKNDLDKAWQVSIPLRVDDTTLGNLELSRRLGRGDLLFQFSSLLNTLVPAFIQQLERRFKQATITYEYTVPTNAEVQTSWLANGRRKV